MTLTRRAVLLAVLPLPTAAPLAWAQRAPRFARVGLLSASIAPPAGERWPVHRIFVERLRDLG